MYQTVILVYKQSDTLNFVYQTYRAIMYPPSAMWYVLASIVGAIILYVIYTRFVHWKRILIIYSAFAYTFLLLCNNYYFISDGTIFHEVFQCYNSVFVSPRNGILLAPVYMGMGFILKDESVSKFLDRHKLLPLIGVSVGIVSLYFEASWLFGAASADDKGFFLSQLLLVPSIVIIGLFNNIKLPLPYLTLRRLSTSIFFMHYTLIYVMVRVPYIQSSATYIFLSVVVLSVIVALITYRLNNKRIKLILG